MRWLKWLLAILLVLLLAALISRLEVRQVVEHLPPSAAVQGNPFLAATRLLERHDIGSRHFPVGRRLHLPAQDTLLVLDQTRARLDQRTSDELLEWLGKGGHLVMAVRGHEHDTAAEWRQRLPLLSELGINIDPVAEGWDADTASPFQSQLEQAGELFMRLCAGTSGELRELCETALCQTSAMPPDTRLPGSGGTRTWRAQLDSGWHLWLPMSEVETSQDDAPSITVRQRWQGDNSHGTQLLNLQVGNGQLTLLTSVNLWHNSRLHWLDHAGLLLRLASEQRNVWFASALSVPPLHLWLWQRSWPLLIALLTLLALFIGYQLPRRGPMLQAPADKPQDFSRHLLAAGQLLERHGDHSALLAPLRQQVLSKLTRRGITARRAPRWCASHTGLDRESIRQALQDHPNDRQQLVTTINTLQQLRNLL